MRRYSAKSVCQGVAVGTIYVYKKGQNTIKREKVTNADAELKRFEDAKRQAIAQLDQLYEKALKDVGEVNAGIFETHHMMLEDEGFNEAIRGIIETQLVNAEFAVARAGDHFAKVFADMEDEYMKARSADVKDISERVIRVLSGQDREISSFREPVIVVAEDLAPSETIQMDRDKVLSFVTVRGSANSHTAILARTMDIPALVNAAIDDLEAIDGKCAIVDAEEGTLIVEPEEERLREALDKQERLAQKKELLKTLRGKETVTRDGRELLLYANIGSLKELGGVLENDAAGIGLFRSEFLYLERQDFPTEEEQFKTYKTAAEIMAGKRVIIRTLDIGADKKCDYFGLAKEENPAMGMRAIRICLSRPEIFKTQLRALFRAAAFGKIAVMYPMITGLNELQRIKAIVREVCDELDAQGIAYRLPEQGVMIETPAAVMMSEKLAKEVDFFSIGTNDLTQYTLAIDRQNEALDDFYDAHHPAVLRMIRMVVENGHKAGIWVGICGELGADTTLTRTFLEMGVDELSVSSGKILPIRKIVRDYP